MLMSRSASRLARPREWTVIGRNIQATRLRHVATILDVVCMPALIHLDGLVSARATR